MSMDQETFNAYCEQVRQSIERIAKEKPQTKVVIMKEFKTLEQIKFIKDCATEYGLKVVVEKLWLSDVVRI